MTPQFGAAPARRGRRRPAHRDPRRVHGACITQLLDGTDACGSALIKVLTVNRQSLLPSALMDYVRRHEALSSPLPVTLPVESFGSDRCSQDALRPCRPPFVLSRTPPPGSRRRARWARQRTAMQWVNLMFAAYSWLATGSAPPGQGVLPPNSPLSPAQAELAQRLLQRSLAIARRRPSGWRGGRSTIRDRLLQKTGLYGVAPHGSAQPLTVHNASLPDNASVVDLGGPLNRPLLASLFATPHAFDRDSVDVPAKLPISFSSVPPSCWSPLLARMWDISMIALLPVDAAAHRRGRPVAAHLFGVVKKASDLLRVIVDRRPRNALEFGVRVALHMVMQARPDLTHDVVECLRLLVLPSAAMFTDIMLGPGETIYIDVDDVKDYFYMLAWPPERWGENAIGLPITVDMIASLATARLDELRALHARLGDALLQPTLTCHGRCEGV